MHSKQCLFMVSYLNHRWLSTNFCNFCWVILEFNKVVCQDHLSETQFYCHINNKFQKKIRQDMWKGTFGQTASVSVALFYIYVVGVNINQYIKYTTSFGVMSMICRSFVWGKSRTLTEISNFKYIVCRYFWAFSMSVKNKQNLSWR